MRIKALVRTACVDDTSIFPGYILFLLVLQIYYIGVQVYSHEL